MIAMQASSDVDALALAFRVVGEVDAATVPELRRALGLTLAVTEGPLVLDLFDMSFIDASGLGTFVWFVNEAEKRGRTVSLRDVSAFTLKLLRIAGLDVRFGLAPMLLGAAPRSSAPTRGSSPTMIRDL